MSTQTLKQRYDAIGDVGKHSNVKPKDLIPISENEVGASLKGTTVESIHTLELEEVNPFNDPVTDSKVIITKEGKAYSVNVGDMIRSEVHIPEPKEEDEGRYLAWTMSNDLHWKKAIGLEEQLGGPIGTPSQSGIIKLYADDSNSWQKAYISVKKG